MRMRFRTDGWHYADLKAFGWRFGDHLGEEGEKVYGTWLADQAEFDKWKAKWDAIPKAEPGDVWRVMYGGEGNEGKIAGYAICCIGCNRVHTWCSAGNCHQDETEHHWTDKEGQDHMYKMCVHKREHTSCWAWSGSAEEGTLTGSPSLLVTLNEVEPGGCNWHGYIQNGDIHP